MAGFWALFEDFGTGGFAAPCWIRHGAVVGSTFMWLGERIPLPFPMWNFLPDNVFNGLIKVDRVDPDKIWIAGTFSQGGNLWSRCYLYSISGNSFALLMDILFIGGSTPFPVDFAQDLTDGTMFLAIGSNGALGEPDVTNAQGVYKSAAQGLFTSIGAGYEHALNSGNINNPRSLTSLDVVSGGLGFRVLHTAHTLSRSSGIQPTGWVTSASSDDGFSWHDPIPTYNGNQFQLECLTVMRVWGGPGNLWYSSDHSGTGAYSTANLTAPITGTLAMGPNAGYRGTIFSSGSMAYPYESDAFHAVAFPTGSANTDLATSADGGASWALTPRPLGHQGHFWYRGARTAPVGLYAAGVSEANATHNSEIWWTPDCAVWHSALAEPDAHGLSLDFGAGELLTEVRRETLTWRDARMFHRQTGYYVGGADDAARRANALAINNLLTPLSNGTLTNAAGPYTSPPQKPTAGTLDTYPMEEMVILLRFLSEIGTVINVAVPCPKAALMLSNQESYSPLNAALSNAASGLPEHLLCNRGGARAVNFLGTMRIMSARADLLDVRTLSPSATSPGL